jgi:hypothetical protein
MVEQVLSANKAVYGIDLNQVAQRLITVAAP